MGRYTRKEKMNFLKKHIELTSNELLVCLDLKKDFRYNNNLAEKKRKKRKSHPINTG